MGGMTKDLEPVPAMQEFVIAMVPSLISSIAKITQSNCAAAPPHGLLLTDICNSVERSLSSSRNEIEDTKKLGDSRGVELPVAPSSTCATINDWSKNAATKRPLCRLSRKRKPERCQSPDKGKKDVDEIITIDHLQENKENEGKERLVPPKRKMKLESKQLRKLTQTEEDEIIRQIIITLPPYELVRWGTSRQLLPPLVYQKDEISSRMNPNDMDKQPSKLTLVLDLDETLVSKILTVTVTHRLG